MAVRGKEDEITAFRVGDLEWRGIGSSPRFYANNVVIRMTIFDLVFRFGEFIETEDGKGFSIREVACVSMSPQHAKAVRKLLDRYIDDYERDNGPIPEPPQAPPQEAKK